MNGQKPPTSCRFVWFTGTVCPCALVRLTSKMGPLYRHIWRLLQVILSGPHDLTSNKTLAVTTRLVSYRWLTSSATGCRIYSIIFWLSLERYCVMFSWSGRCNLPALQRMEQRSGTNGCHDCADGSTKHMDGMGDENQVLLVFQKNSGWRNYIILS